MRRLRLSRRCCRIEPTVSPVKFSNRGGSKTDVNKVMLQMRIRPTSFAFTVLLGLVASVPFSGIDINLPALAATGAALGARPSEVGLTMSVFMLSLAAAPLVYGPVSDRYGRKPVVVTGIALFMIGSLACGFAPSLPALLTWRFFQGVGAAGTTTAMAIVRDLFDGETARAKIAKIVIAIIW